MSGVRANGTKPENQEPSHSSDPSNGASFRTVPKAVTLEYGVPVEVRLEVELRPGRRMRRTAPNSLRVTVNYHLSALVDESSGGCLFGEFRDEEQMSAFFQNGIAQAVKAGRSALRKATNTPVGKSMVKGHLPRAITEPRQKEALAVERDPVVPVALDTALVTLEPEWLDAQPEPHVTLATPKGMTSAQRRTIEIMRDQLRLGEKAFQDVLEMHCNRPNLDALNYREAAGLVTRLSRQVRQKLELERRIVSN